MSNGYENHKSAIESARATDGKFGHISRPEASVDLQRMFNEFDLEQGEGDQYNEYADGTVIEDLYVENTGEDGYVVRSNKTIYDLPGLISDATGINYSTAQWTLENESDRAAEFLATRYDAYVNSEDENNWTLEFHTPLGPDELTGRNAADAVWNRTKIIDAHNEQDHGTFGAENLGRLMADALNIKTRIPA